MWSVQSDKIMKQNKKKERVNFLISKVAKENLYFHPLMDLTSKNSSIPHLPPSRPLPDCL